METQDILIAVLAVTTVAELIALLIAYRRIKAYEDGGAFRPGKDCLRIIYYYLAEEEITGDQTTDLQKAEKVEVTFPIEENDEIISAEGAYRKIRPMPPPPSNKRVIAIEVTIVRDCANNGKK